MTTIICRQHLHAMARAAQAALAPLNDEIKAGRPEADRRTPSADVALHLRVASDKFGELTAIFDILARRTAEQDDLHKLARLGKDVAQDYEEQAACWREELEAEAHAVKPRNPAQAPRQAAGDAQVSPEAEPGASGPDLQPWRNIFAQRQEAALLAAFRLLEPRERIKLLRRARRPRIVNR